MTSLTVDDILQSRILMLASYAVTSDQLEASLAGSGWQTVPVAGEALFYRNPLLLSPVNAFAARSGDTVAIAFQGTDEPIDWISNFGGGIVSWAPLYAAYTSFFVGLFDYLASAAAAGVTKILVTGHSQGAAMVEYFLKEMGSIDSRIVGVTFASPGINQSLDFLGDDRLLRLEHSDDIVVDAAQEFGTIGTFQDTEFDLKVVLGVDNAIQGAAEHGSGVYAATTRILFWSAFGQEILDNYENMRAWIGFETSQSMYGGAGRDVIFGQGGHDNIYGGGSRDLIDGGEGSDDLRGEAGDDELRGGASFDFLYGGTENDKLYGGDSYDYLYGESNLDTLYGGTGNDNLYGGAGNDSLFGDENDDRLSGESGNDSLDGGSGTDTAEYSRSFQGTAGVFNYQLVSLGGGRFTVRDLASGSPEGTDTLERIEYITFGSETRTVADWVTRAGGTAPINPTPIQETPYVPTSPLPDTPNGVSNAQLSVTPISRQLTVGQSVALSDLFPASSWIDGDGAYDIVRFAVQDRTAGGGYLTHMGRPVSPNQVHEMPISDLVNWRFVAGSGAATDQIGFNIIQADGDFSPRLTTGAVVTTVLPVVTNPVSPTPVVVEGTEVARLDLDLRSGSSADEGESAQFTIQRRGNQDGDIVVEWRIEGIGDNPADRRDFPAMSGTVTLYDDRGDRNFSIGLTQDQVDELNESFRIELRVVSGNTVFDDEDANFTIIDDDLPLGIDPNVDDHGNSFSTATVVAEDRWARGFIEQPGDQDYFRFDLLGGIGYEFILYKDDDLSLIGGDPNADYPTLPQPITELYNSAGQLIATIPATSLSARWALQYETPADGTYYLRVRESGDNDVGQYFVKADIRVEADDFAANLSTSAILPAEGSILGHHERSTDIDWIAVDLVAGETYRFSLVSDERLLVDGSNGGVDGSNGWYYFGYPDTGFSLVDSSGSVVGSRIGGDSTSSNLFEFMSTQSQRLYLAVDATVGFFGQLSDYVVKSERVLERPSDPGLVVQPDPTNVADFRFSSVRDASSVAIDDGTLTVNNDTSSAIRFDLSGQTGIASYAAVEIYLFASGAAVTGDIAIDIPLNTLNAGSTLGDIGSIEFVTAVQTSGVGQWVTIEITDLYNQWISGERTNNGILLSTTEFSSDLMSFYSSNYTADPLLRPRLVLDGPDIIETVYGQTTGSIAEDDGSISGLIGLTGGGAGFADAFTRGRWGTISVNETGQSWTYELDSRSEALRGGQLVTENLVITSGSGVSQAVRITITGQDDATVVFGSGEHLLSEVSRTVTGRAAISDLDALVAPTFVAGIRTGAYGQFNIAADGTWSYTLSNAGILALGSGATGTETIPLNASNGTPVEFAFTISGTDNDRVNGSAANEIFSSGIGNDTMNGASGNDVLTGGAGNDLLTGGAGNDQIDGGDGGDRAYFTGSLSATVNLGLTTAQITGHGTDTILNVEHITSGSGNDRLTGNARGNSMIAGNGNDTMNGATGNDVLYGGFGLDSLTGGSGRDIFVFNTTLGSGNGDRITDFSEADDTIRLDDAVFVGLTNGSLAISAFAANLTGAATDAFDRVIYETDTGRLYFDADGSGAGVRVHFATLDTNLALTSIDFFVF